MAIPTTVTFDGLAKSDALEACVLEHVARLERLAADILTCRTVISLDEHRHHQGNRFSVQVRLTMRGHEIEASSGPLVDGRYEDPYVAVNDAFEALRRRIEDQVRRRRGDVKTHARRPSPE
ncbi:MAG: ribosome-associated translation inhibitor RaiA [Rhodanobacteraceae bacterium]|jgi:ribosome-associated translation inhibitor RaiA|nr:ribosome-associated translation inhibitor RaiA [Rhodanobacteraceae bacterium]